MLAFAVLELVRTTSLMPALSSSAALGCRVSSMLIAHADWGGIAPWWSVGFVVVDSANLKGSFGKIGGAVSGLTGLPTVASAADEADCDDDT